MQAAVAKQPAMHRQPSEKHLFKNERLYEAYNDLHALAQGFNKNFDAPAILVVGQQSDGKSSIIEVGWLRVSSGLPMHNACRL